MLENRTEAKVVIQHVSEVDDVSRGTNAVTSSNVYVVIAAHILIQRFSEQTVWYPEKQSHLRSQACIVVRHRFFPIEQSSRSASIRDGA